MLLCGSGMIFSRSIRTDVFFITEDWLLRGCIVLCYWIERVGCVFNTTEYTLVAEVCFTDCVDKTMIEFISNTITVVDFADTVSKHKECQQIQSDFRNGLDFVFGFVNKYRVIAGMVHILYTSAICAEQNESDVEKSELLNSSGMCLRSGQNLRRS